MKVTQLVDRFGSNRANADPDCEVAAALAATAGSDLLAELARLRAENETLAKLVERMAGNSVVWADDATPFTGEQVKELLAENERLRRLNESLTERCAGQSDSQPPGPPNPPRSTWNEMA